MTSRRTCGSMVMGTGRPTMSWAATAGQTAFVPVGAAGASEESATIASVPHELAGYELSFRLALPCGWLRADGVSERVPLTHVEALVRLGIALTDDTRATA